MRYFTVLVSVLVVFGMAAVSLAGSDIPDLKGTWTMNCSAIGHEKPAEGPPPEIHAEKLGLHDLKMILVIDKQDGFRFSGYIESNRKKDIISGVIGFDNKSVYWVSEGGMDLAELVSPDKMETIYLRVSPHYSIAARTIVTRER